MTPSVTTKKSSEIDLPGLKDADIADLLTHSLPKYSPELPNGVLSCPSLAALLPLAESNNCVGALTPFSERLAKVSRVFTRFAEDAKLVPNSDTWYDHEYQKDRSSRLAFASTSQEYQGRIIDSTPFQLISFLQKLGFVAFDKEAAFELVDEVVSIRAFLSNFYPNQKLPVVTQVSVGAISRIPHIHSDLAIGFTLTGPSTRLLTPSYPEHLELKAQFRGNVGLLQTILDYDQIVGEKSSVPEYTHLFLKGLRISTLPFGHPNNLGCFHCSPVEIDAPRLFIANFVVPPNWDVESYIIQSNKIPYTRISPAIAASTEIQK
jgi:hypothetical protein